jgi:putative MATE family efflux protein
MVGYVDTAMVGSLGAEATAAVAVINPLLWLTQGGMNAAAAGFGIQVARHVGVGNLALARRIVRQGLLVVVIGGLILTGLLEFLAGWLPALLGAAPRIAVRSTNYLRIVTSAYLLHFSMIMCGNILRSTGDTQTPLRVNIFVNLLNVGGNFLLIFPTRTVVVLGASWRVWGAGWGVEGAAVATALSLSVAGLFLFASLFRKKGGILDPRQRGSYKADGGILRTAWILGLPMALERMSLSFGQLMVVRVVAGLGTLPLAAYYLSITAESISYLPGYGLGMAATTLIGQSLGAGKRDLARVYARLCNIFCVIMMSGAGVMLFIFSGQLISLFTPDQGVVELGRVGLRIMAFSEPFFGLSIVNTGILRGAGETKKPFLITLTGMWCLRMGSMYLLCYRLALGIYGAWVAMALDLLYRGLVTWWLYMRGKWLYYWDNAESI